MILDDRFSVERLPIAFIKCPFFKAEKEITSLILSSLTEEWKQRKYRLINSLPLSSLVLECENKKANILIWQPMSVNSDLVVFLTNFTDGWQTMLYHYYNKYRREIINVSFSDPSREYPFYLFGYMQYPNERRVQAMKDESKWEFFEKGLVMPFENPNYYKKRRVSDRLNNAIIEEYLKKNGIDVSENEFWMSNGDAVEFSTEFNY